MFDIGGFVGDIGAALIQKRAMDKSLRQQEEFARSGIQMRVADARAAGINPLAALGAGFTPAPVMVGEHPMATLASRMGQRVSRAAEAAQDPNEKARQRLSQLAIQKGELEVAMLQSDLANRTGTGPGVPTLTEPVRVSPGTEMPGQAPGKSQSYMFYETPSGGLAPIPSPDIKQQIEDMPIQEALWSLRNQLVPNISPSAMRPSKKAHPLPEGYEWVWNPVMQEFRKTRVHKDPLPALPYNEKGGGSHYDVNPSHRR